MQVVAENVALSDDSLESMIDSVMNGGYILRDYTNVSQEDCAAAYALAHQLINQRQYVKAEQIFTFLCRLDHYNARYWLGLGASRQLQNSHEEAVGAYALAGFHDVENPIPALRSAECYLAMNQPEHAAMGATAAIHWAGDQPKYAQIRARAELILEGIRHQKEGQP